MDLGKSLLIEEITKASNDSFLNTESCPFSDISQRKGVIYGPKTVTFSEGESVYDILQREMKNNRIQMESEFTAMYNSAYVQGINNLYEKDCGQWSGWMYEVNGWYPNYGCSRYQVQDGDNIEWHYTCDLGRDLGAGMS